MKNFFLTAIVLFVVWLMLNSSISTQIVISGVIVAVVISSIFKNSFSLLTDVKLSIKTLIYIPIYFCVFIKELIFSNIDVALRVITPSLPINPGIVKVKTKLKSKTGRLVLANSITLTPGTLTVDICEEYLYIHWIDIKNTKGDIDKATSEIVENFEKYLEVIYG